MELDRYADRLRGQLAAVADTGSEDQRALAERMSTALEPALRLALLELLTEAAGEISRDLAPGSVDVRLRGRDPELVVARPMEAAPAAPASTPAEPEPVVGDDEPATFRTTLRLPDRLKTRVEQAASAQGVSVNTWLVRAVAAALGTDQRRPAPRTGDRFTGWVR
ncbi:histidine kinase [Amnibacterium setariae]|uniref:Histidine kinase n=1 Tax=Amnibacterium setariae TaxID=2306585 RepID=A0A3A1U287_9MICO|nr:histidine kinase [Amnibacterium setariae]RIX30460.1 histidine kinase [Amnibacterium setariae]